MKRIEIDLDSIDRNLRHVSPNVVGDALDKMIREKLNRIKADCIREIEEIFQRCAVRISQEVSGSSKFVMFIPEESDLMEGKNP